MDFGVRKNAKEECKTETRSKAEDGEASGRGVGHSVRGPEWKSSSSAKPWSRGYWQALLSLCIKIKSVSFL